MDVYLKMKAQGKTPSIEEIKRAFESGKLEGKKTKPDPRYKKHVILKRWGENHDRHKKDQKGYPPQLG
ncbi:MAG: hypothetical protein AB1523_01135 [Bacillota bacterium]